MHSLKGTFVKDEPKETIDKAEYFPLKILFPPKKARTLFFATEAQKDEWKAFLREAIGY